MVQRLHQEDLCQVLGVPAIAELTTTDTEPVARYRCRIAIPEMWVKMCAGRSSMVAHGAELLTAGELPREAAARFGDKEALTLTR